MIRPPKIDACHANEQSDNRSVMNFSARRTDYFGAKKLDTWVHSRHVGAFDSHFLKHFDSLFYC